MARTASYAGNPKTVAATAVQTLTWTSSEIDSTGVVGFYFAFAGNGNAVVDIDRVRIRAAGQVIVELTLAQLLSLQGSYSDANFFDATAGQRLYIPLNFLDGPTMEARDQCQFPPGAEAQVEVVTLNTTVAGTAILGWQISNQTPKYFPRMLTASGNIAVGPTKNAKFTFSDGGIIRAIGFDSRGIDRAELTISGQRAWNLPGPGFTNLVTTAVYGDMLSEKDVAEFSDSASATQNYRWHSVDLNIPGANGSTNLILDVTSEWPGTASEIAVYSVDDVRNFRGGR